MPGPTEQLSGDEPRARGLIGSVWGRFDASTNQFRGEGLRAQTLRGSSWTLLGFGAQQVLRLGSNLILTRLLFPEAFGLMALAQVFMQGLAMLSDIGVGPSIVQNKRGEDPEFLATAWTMQVIRGFTLFLCMCLLAYPASLLYDEPLLFPILILIGLTSVMRGFQNIGLALAGRRMLLGRLTVLDLLSHIVGIVSMVVWAYFHPTVWALVAGGLISTLFRVMLGYLMFDSGGNRFRFEGAAVSEIFHFGKWIFLGTAMTYLGGQGLRLIQGALVPMDVLGMISIAGMLALSMRQLIQRIGGQVLFPAFSKLLRERPDNLHARLREIRGKIFIATLPFFALLILMGQQIIDLLYDDRYQQAGVYLMILATGAAITSARTPFGMVLLSVGDSYGHSFIMTVGTILNISGTVLGFAFGGVQGMLIGGVISEVLVYPFESWRLRHAGLWMPFFDLSMYAVYLLIGGVSYYLL